MSPVWQDTSNASSMQQIDAMTIRLPGLKSKVIYSIGINYGSPVFKSKHHRTVFESADPSPLTIIVTRKNKTHNIH